MPELPDVEIFKQYFDATALHQTITAVYVGDHRILQDLSENDLRSYSLDSKFESTFRHGKNLFVHLTSGAAVLLHFGMSGDLKYYQHSDDQPKHARVIWTFDNGFHLAYISIRMFGKVAIVQNSAAYLTDQHLGPDALSMDWQQFFAIFKNKRGMVKSALMDQSTLAGLGNIYVDELLFHAQIHPETSVEEMNEAEIHELFKTMKSIINTAIDVRVNFEDFPDDYLINHRDKQGTCPICSKDLERIQVASRTTYYCPQCQMKMKK